MAGAPGFEPGLSVLETDVLAVDTMPLQLIYEINQAMLNPLTKTYLTSLWG